MAEISPLRRRMIEDMTVRNLSPATQRSYVGLLKKPALRMSILPPSLPAAWRLPAGGGRTTVDFHAPSRGRNRSRAARRVAASRLRLSAAAVR